MDALFTRRLMITMLVRSARPYGLVAVGVFGFWMRIGVFHSEVASGLLRKQTLLTFCSVFRFQKPSRMADEGLMSASGLAN
jgi:hypothetical protein